MSDLRKNIQNFTDERLLEQYKDNKNDYTEVALAIMKEEIETRKLLHDGTGKTTNSETHELDGRETDITDYESDDFIPFPHFFSTKELLLTREILTEEKIPGIIKSIEPNQSKRGKELFTLLVPKQLYETAQNLIHDYFEISGDEYSRKFSDTKDRLKSFQFNEIHYSQIELNEEIDVEINVSEGTQILGLIKKLIKEADYIEGKGTILFYFDNLEPCEQKLSKTQEKTYTLADLLTILEVLQVYCDDASFPPLLLNSANGLLDFISSKC